MSQPAPEPESATGAEPQWCLRCGLRLIEAQRFRQRESRDPNVFCGPCRKAIDDEFEEG